MTLRHDQVGSRKGRRFRCSFGDAAGSVLCGILSADTGGIERRGHAQISYACPHVSRAAASSQRLTAAMRVSILIGSHYK